MGFWAWVRWDVPLIAFFYIIQSEYFRHGEGAYKTLVEAAKSMEFKYLMDVFRLEGEMGSDYENQDEVVAKHSRAIESDE
jgi:hypothetical protein